MGTAAERELPLQSRPNAKGQELGTTPAHSWVPGLPAPRQREVAVPELKWMGAELSKVCPGPWAVWPASLGAGVSLCTQASSLLMAPSGW